MSIYHIDYWWGAHAIDRDVTNETQALAKGCQTDNPGWFVDGTKKDAIIAAITFLINHPKCRVQVWSVDEGKIYDSWQGECYDEYLDQL